MNDTQHHYKSTQAYREGLTTYEINNIPNPDDVETEEFLDWYFARYGLEAPQRLMSEIAAKQFLLSLEVES